MNKKVWLGIVVCGLGIGLGSVSPVCAADDSPGPGKEMLNEQFVNTTFRSLCLRAPDPASLNYYLNVLDDETRTAAEVHAAIETTCLRHSQADACSHVAGLSDLCPAAAN